MISSKPVELFKHDLFNVEQIVRRITGGYEKKAHYTTMSAIFACQGSGRSSILNLCQRFASENTNATARVVTWIKPFEAWKMTSMGNLLIAMLWHIHRNIPDVVAKDEKILYKLGRISVALSAISGTAAQMQGMTSDTKALELISKSLPPERKSQISSIFSACEQVEGLAEEFASLGEIICEFCHCDSIVVPIDDVDRCVPVQVVPFLVSLRTLVASKYFSFLVTADQNVLTQFFKSSYFDVFSDEQARSFVYKLFDDWVSLPSPHLNRLLETISFPEKSTGVAFINYVLDAGLYSVAAKPASLIRACRRFELFLNDGMHSVKASPVNYLGWFGWFLIGAECPQVIIDLSRIPDLVHLFRSLRGNTSPAKSQKVTSKKDTRDSMLKIRFDKVTNSSAAPIPATSARTGQIHPAARNFLNEPESPLMRFVEATRVKIKEEDLVVRFREVLPFI